VAAGILLLFGLTVFREPATPRAELRALARPGDVKILAVEAAPEYTLVLSVGDADDAAAIWVVPADDEPEG
jgi:hypothetical protein